MLNINFSLTNPFSDRFETLYQKCGKLWGHKVWEVQFEKSTSILYFLLRVTTRQSHAGVYVDIGLFGYDLFLELYDDRHWNHENKCWEADDSYTSEADETPVPRSETVTLPTTTVYTCHACGREYMNPKENT